MSSPEGEQAVLETVVHCLTNRRLAIVRTTYAADFARGSKLILLSCYDLFPFPSPPEYRRYGCCAVGYLSLFDADRQHLGGLAASAALIVSDTFG
jgi:hypothetical protein